MATRPGAVASAPDLEDLVPAPIALGDRHGRDADSQVGGDDLTDGVVRLPVHRRSRDAHQDPTVALARDFVAAGAWDDPHRQTFRPRRAPWWFRIHAAIMGSLERFLSIYIEHTAGLFPLWMAPTQVGLVPVADTHEEYARRIETELKSKGLRTQFFSHEESLGKRIRDGEKQKIPYLLVMGDKEIEAKSVTVRNVKTKKQVTVSVDEFLEKMVSDVAGRVLEPSIG